MNPKISKKSISSAILRQYLAFTRPYLAPLSLYLASLSLAALASTVLAPLLVKYLVDELSASGGGATREVFWRCLFLIAGIGGSLIFSTVNFFVADRMIVKVNPQVFRDIEVECLRRLHARSYLFFADRYAGSLVSQIKRFAMGYELVSYNATRGMLLVALELVASIFVTALFSLPLASLFLLWGGVYLLLAKRLLLWKMKFDRNHAASESAATGVLSDSITNFLAVKTRGVSCLEEKKIAAAGDIRAAHLRESWLATGWINLLQSGIGLVFQLSLLTGALVLWWQGQLTAGTVVMVQSFAFSLTGKLSELGSHIKSIFRGLAGAEEMTRLLLESPEIEDPKEPVSIKAATGSISFSQVRFRYAPAIPLFEEFSLSLAPGERVGLVGPSGAGKSTLVKLLLRFLEPDSGSVKVDGVDIRSLAQASLRRSIAYVPQEPALFHRSLRENICYGFAEVPEEKMQQACRRAQLGDLLKRLPEGLDTVVGERGIKLSGGERQRVAIARVLLSDATIFLLDEPTGALDAESEELIQRALDEVLVGRTTIVIAHRLATVQKLDRIVVLKEGAIVEEGSHADLVRRSGLYAHFWSRQGIVREAAA